MGKGNKKQRNSGKAAKETFETINNNSIDQSELTQSKSESVHEGGDKKSEGTSFFVTNAPDSFLDPILEEMSGDLDDLMEIIERDLQSSAVCHEPAETTSTNVVSNMEANVQRDFNGNLQPKPEGKEDYATKNSCQPTTSKTRESDEKFQNMTDVSVYYKKNVEECNEAYERYAQEDKSRKTLGNVLDLFPKKRRDEIAENLEGLKFKKPNVRDSRQSKTNPERPNLITVTSSENEFRTEKTATAKISSTCVEGLFKQHCIRKMRSGSCSKGIYCQYSHDLSPDLQNLGQSSPEVIKEVLRYAIYNGYNYLVRFIYPDVIKPLDYQSVMELFNKLCDSGLIIDEYIAELTITAATESGVSLRKFSTDVANSFCMNADAVAECVLKVMGSKIGQESYWDICRDLLIVAKPSIPSIARVIGECVQSQDKLQAQDVYLNFMGRLTPEQLASLDVNLRRQFDALLEQNDFFSETRRSNPAFFEHPLLWSNRRFAQRRNNSATRFGRDFRD